MPPMPPPGIAGACGFGRSATIASVVMSRPAIEAAPCNPARTDAEFDFLGRHLRLLRYGV
jgi:hypothetical protein